MSANGKEWVFAKGMESYPGYKPYVEIALSFLTQYESKANLFVE
jgi:hypothetical protein